MPLDCSACSSRHTIASLLLFAALLLLLRALLLRAVTMLLVVLGCILARRLFVAFFCAPCSLPLCLSAATLLQGSCCYFYSLALPYFAPHFCFSAAFSCTLLSLRCDSTVRYNSLYSPASPRTDSICLFLFSTVRA